MKSPLSPIRWLWAALLLAVAAVAFSGCNAQKKNTAAIRQYNAFITRYNIYYNGDKHYRETLDDMEARYEDDYSRRVFMHPVEAKADPKAPQPSGGFDRSIEKAQKAIQMRSIKKKPKKKSGMRNNPEYKAWMKRDEYNPFLHNAWMMMGRSQYFNGDFLGAASTFFYVAKHFTWLPATVTEAKLWQARSYLALDWLYEAELIISRIKPDDLASKQLQTLYDHVYADFWLRSGDDAKALPYLQAAVAASKGAQRTRLQFLLGQLYSSMGQKQLAYQAFKKAGSASSASYRTKFNARIKQSEVYEGANIEPEVKSLLRMAKYDRNKEYLDQIYYAIGNLYLSRRDTAKAIANYVLAAEKSTRGGVDKAISQITLGGLYFEQGNYEKAQPCYSEAVPLLPESYPDYKLLKRRSDVLDELAVYSQNVNLQDSLLNLAAMPEAERLAVIDKIIDELNKREKEEAENAAREEYLAEQEAQGNQLTDKNQREFNINTDGSWYFYNSSARASGKTEFQRRWGSRKLEDDWRRRNKSTFNASDFDAAGDDDEDDESADEADSPDGGGDGGDENKEGEDKASDPHNREYYLAQIPFSEEAKATSHEVIQEGLYNMGIILKDDLEDFASAGKEFDRLLADYPDNVYRLDVYYNLFLMMMRQGREAEAEKYKQLILRDFPDSPYGQALAKPGYFDNLRNMDANVQKMYDKAYQAYLDNNNAAVHAAYASMQEMYPLSKTMPKFMFIDALAYVTEKDFDKFNATLRLLLERYPDTDITPIASSWLKGMAQGRNLQSTGGNMRGLLWDIHLTNDSTLAAGDSTSVAFEINDDAPQLLVLVYATDEVPTNELLYEVARFNFNSFVVKDFDLEPMNFGRLGMLIIKGFDNFREINHYRSTMASSQTFKLPPGVRPVAISAKNFTTMLEHGRTFDDYFRFLQEQNYVDAQADVLQPTEIETLEEAQQATEEMQQPATQPDGQPDTQPATQPATQPDTQPGTQPATQPATQPDGQPATQPATQPDTQPATQPATQPGKKPAAKPKPKTTQSNQTKSPQQPDYPVGSEGDDPLLDEP